MACCGSSRLGLGFCCKASFLNLLTGRWAGREKIGMTACSLKIEVRMLVSIHQFEPRFLYTEFVQHLSINFEFCSPKNDFVYLDGGR
jgi:hypothetical protein